MKEKKLNNTIKFFTGIFLLFVLASCSEEVVLVEQMDRTELDSLETQISVITDDITEAKTTANELQRRLDSLNAVLASASTPSGLNADVHYTVQVTNGSGSYIEGRVAALPNALVTVNQGNVAMEVTTDDTGMATFPELESGFISVTVEIADYSDVYMIVDLRDGGTDSNGTNADTRYASTQVMVFPTTGSDMFTISGTAYYNPDLDDDTRDGSQNNPFHPYTGTEVWDPVPSGNTFRIDCTPSSIPLNTTRPGQIIQAVYAGLGRESTIGSGGQWTVELPVVLLNSGAQFFNYSGPNLGNTFSGTQTSTVFGDSDETWYPAAFYPNSLGEITLFPGGDSFQDLYYFTN